LYLLAGLEAGIPITKNYTIDNSGSNTIPDIQTRLAGAIGIGYAIPIADNIFLLPEASYRIPFSKVSSRENPDYLKDWQVPQIRVGLSLVFGPKRTPKQEITEEAPVSLNVGFKEIRAYDRAGNVQPVNNIRVEDIQYTELFPLIPYVFMDLNQSQPSPRNQVLLERSQRGEFNIAALEPDAVKINNRTLDIIGKRMSEIPNSDLTITGTLDGKDEMKNKDLGMQRADFVKQYLVNNFNINSQRINTRSLGLPSKPSSLTIEDGIEENRRVELSSSNPLIFEPIIISSDNERLAEPNIIEFITLVETNDVITSWEFDISQSDKTLKRSNGADLPNSFQWTIRPNELESKQIPVDYRLSVSTKRGAKRQVTGSIPVEYFSTSRKKTQDLPDKIISKFSLVLFDFDKAEVSPADMEIIDKYILPAIKFNSTVQVYGYTDRIGDEEYNRKLAERRATAVSNIIKQKKKDVKIETFDVGEKVLIFDNDTPVGRHLSRTVQVIVTTPK
jgi:outer membrane protein OmpA-like peptidoglycan-associated protein